MTLRFFLAAATFGAMFAAGCSPNGGGTFGVPAPANPAAASGAVKPHSGLTEPALIAFDDGTNRLEYWPLRSDAGGRPHMLSRPLGVSQATAMVANGDLLYIATTVPFAITTYDVDTKATGSLPVLYGAPKDLAIDKSGTLYAVNDNGVAVYPGGSSHPFELTCALMADGLDVAVDDEGDVIVNGITPEHQYGFVEYSAGSTSCSQLTLRPAKGYVTGIVVDPKNDNLVVLDNVYCAGGREGRITSYRPPYGSKVEHVRNLDANCPGELRLDATATLILFADSEPDVPRQRANPARERRRRCVYYACIDQQTFPEARRNRTYTGGSPYAFTTIPNSLPN